MSTASRITTTMPQVTLLARYQEALDAATSATPDTRVSRLLDLLLLREQLAYTLRTAPPPSPAALVTISNLDGQLRHIAPSLVAVAGSETIAEWRGVLQPAAESWWWSLTPTQPQAPHWVSRILIAVVLTVALSLALDIAIRLQVFGPGADFFTIFSGLAQILLALLAGSTLTQTGAGVTGRILDRLQITHHRERATVALASIPLLLVMLCWLALPAMAHWYYLKGYEAYQAGHVRQAIPFLQRSVSLNPNFRQAYYTLGVAHEDALEYEAAVQDYQAAVALDPQFFEAYNNFARLYILRLNDSSSALDLLAQAFAQNPSDIVRPTLLKNRGWARLTRGLFALAERDLSDALAIDAQDAEAHCLLARTFEEREEPDLSMARTHWQACLANPASQIVAAELSDQAREREERP